MTERVLGPTGSPRRRWTLLLPLALVSLLAAFYIPSASAVHDFGGLGDGGVFELDNNALDDATVPGTPPTNAGDDWQTLIGGGPGNALGSADEQTAVPVTDATNSSTDDTFCGGTKENQDLAAWKWCNNAASNDKNDLEDAYSAIYTVPDTATGICPTLADPSALCAGDKILYVGADRFANNGDSGLGFMFIQSGLGGNTCPAPSTNCTFNNGQGGTPHHTNGDIYVVSQFTGGGQGVTVDFYVWAGGNAGNWQLDTSGVDCDASSPNDVACGTVFGDGDRKTNTCEDAPWNYVTKFPGDSPCTASDFAEGTFFEGGVNLTQRNITGCFKTILVDTSQSQNINESAQDFVFAPFEGCNSGITTFPQTAAGGTLTSSEIPAAARVDVKDHAAITSNASGSFHGTVQFFLCGPFALDYAENCSTGGVQIGSPPEGETVNGASGTAAVDSDTATLTSVGKYCWRAVYSGDSTIGVPGSTDPAKSVAAGGTQSECFTITPVTPTLTTSAGADVVLGNPITDTATLTGTAKQPGTGGLGPGGTINAAAATQNPAGGSITWTLRGPGNCTDAGLTITGSPVDPISGDGTYPSGGSVSATPTVIGTYTWVASYSGNSPNTNGDSSHCPTQAGEGDEQVVVTGTASASSKQRWLPNDTVTLTGSTNLNGSLTITLYSGDNCGVTSGSAISGQGYPFTVTNAASGSTFTTTNTTFFVGTNPNGSAGGAAGAYSWLVHYHDNNLSSPADHCETSTVSPITD